MNLLQRLGLLMIIGIVLAVAIHHLTRPATAPATTLQSSQAQ